MTGPSSPEARAAAAEALRRRWADPEQAKVLGQYPEKRAKISQTRRRKRDETWAGQLDEELYNLLIAGVAIRKIAKRLGYAHSAILQRMKDRGYVRVYHRSDNRWTATLLTGAGQLGEKVATGVALGKLVTRRRGDDSDR